MVEQISKWAKTQNLN